MLIIKCHCGHETRLYRFPDAANYLAERLHWKHPTASLRYHIYHAGNIEPIRFGKILLFTQDILDNFIANRGRPKKPR